MFTVRRNRAEHGDNHYNYYHNNIRRSNVREYSTKTSNSYMIILYNIQAHCRRIEMIENAQTIIIMESILEIIMRRLCAVSV